MGKERPFLDVVVADEPKVAVLCEHGGFIVNGTVFETEEYARCDSAAA
jgi:hypothetical protein